MHRDIKPENVLLSQEGRVKIADFGIAKVVGGDGKQPALTRDEQIIGTPHYMAPEQVEHPQRADHRVDIYSLGVVFYEMLTGELPLRKFQPPSRKVQVDVRLDEIVVHALDGRGVANKGGIFPGTNDLAIGGLVGGLPPGQVISPFVGIIDEPALYNWVLSEEQIQTIYRAAARPR